MARAGRAPARAPVRLARQGEGLAHLRADLGGAVRDRVAHGAAEVGAEMGEAFPLPR